MNKKEIVKPSALFYKVNLEKKNYVIQCEFHQDENCKRKGNHLRCVTEIKIKKFAEYLEEYLQNYWDNNQKILRFYDAPKSANVKITDYCEFHPTIEKNKLYKQYRNKDKQVKNKTKESMNNNINKGFKEIEQLVKESYQRMEEIKQTIKEIKEVSK